MSKSNWISGPTLLLKDEAHSDETFHLDDPEGDKEVRPRVVPLATNVKETLGTTRFHRFSSWKRLVQSVCLLKQAVKSFHSNKKVSLDHTCTADYSSAEEFIIRVVQQECYGEEMKYLSRQKPLPKNSRILALNPVIDDEGMMRVGGRLKYSDLALNQRNPLIIPGQHHIALLLVRHFHEKIKHQGRHFTDGSIRAAGLWIVGGKKLISSVIHKCVQCQKLRGKTAYQLMSDLPADRLTSNPPFTYVGLDTFGPWKINTRRTRGTQVNTKRWAILFTCLVSRAIHIEVVEDMSGSAFVNALRRFIAIRGNVSELRSDRGTNFIAAANMLKFNVVNVEVDPVKKFLYENRVKWTFNPPHSSHMGGAWERLIGTSRRILDSMLSESSLKNLTHDVLVTLMAEVAAIVNNRPIVPVSTDPENPFILSPSTLLTHKTGQEPDFMVECDVKDMYKAEWKRVQVLAETFWRRWRQEYLMTLQTRRKWTTVQTDVKKGDVVLLKDINVCRNGWPMAIVEDSLLSADSRVRKVVIRVVNDGKATIYTRPITDLIVLVRV
jgi:hypothetical protein